MMSQINTFEENIKREYLNVNIIDLVDVDISLRCLKHIRFKVTNDEGTKMKLIHLR